MPPPKSAAVREFLLLLSAGAFGGLLSWVWSFTFGVPLGDLSDVKAAFVSVLLGAGAAVIGIHIARTDTRHLIHALSFAVLCGFSWQLVYDAGLSTVERQVARKQIEESAEEVEQARRQLASPQAQAGQVFEELAGTTSAALASAGAAKSEEAEEQVTRSSLAALEAIGTHAEAAPPDATSAAIERIATAALEAGRPEIAQRAVETLTSAPRTPESVVALERIAKMAEHRQLPEIAAAARPSLTSPRRQLEAEPP
jgi:hypothetical protein